MSEHDHYDPEYEQFKADLVRLTNESRQARAHIPMVFLWSVILGILLLSQIVTGNIEFFNFISVWAYLLTPFAILFTLLYVYVRFGTRKRKRKNLD